jgi:transposase
VCGQKATPLEVISKIGMKKSRGCFLVMELANKQRKRIKGIVPDQIKRADGKGRPARDKRQVLEGVLWILRTGALWKDLPERFPPYQTCHRRFQQLQEQAVMRQLVEALAKDLMARGSVDLSECFIDGSFCMAKKGALLWARLGGVKAPNSWQSRTLQVLFYLSQSSRPLLMK